MASEKENTQVSQTKIPYPKSIPFILTTEFCERFSYYGMRAILVLFVSNVIGFSDTNASMLFHGFTVVAYITPIFGAILADSYFGKFNVIFYLSFFYAIGQMVIVLASVGNKDGGIPGLPMTALLFIGLIMVGCGTGGIKPCVATFGGDQFKLPEQKKQSELFFSIFYWAVNLGSFISMIVTPQLRSGVACLGEDYCYPLAFGVPAALMFVALLVFGIGRVIKLYKINMPDRSQENLIKKTLRCIWFCLRADKVPGESHWLDRGINEFGETFKDDVKAVLNVAFMMLPLPIFWALFDQQGSRWTLQATRMNGNFFDVFRLEPDNIQVANAIMILVMIPLFNTVIYPLFAKCNLLTTSLQRIGLGFFMAALAFGVSGILDLELEKTYPKLPEKGFGQLQLYAMYPDTTNCTIQFTISDINLSVESSFSNSPSFREPYEIAEGTYNLTIDDALCKEYDLSEVHNHAISIPNEESTSLYFWLDSTDNKKIQINQGQYLNKIEKSGSGRPYVKVLWSSLNASLHEQNNTIKFLRNNNANKEKDIFIGSETTFGDTDPIEVGKPGDYAMYINEKLIQEEISLQQGANYNLLLLGEKVVVHQVTPENSISMFWQLPQYFIMTMGEILFSVSTMEFCYTQAPVSMKAVTLGLRYLTNAFGNIIDIVVMGAFEGVLPKQAYEFFLFAGLTLFFMALFIWMSIYYKYVDYTNFVEKTEQHEKKGINNDGAEDDE